MPSSHLLLLLVDPDLLEGTFSLLQLCDENLPLVVISFEALRFRLFESQLGIDRQSPQWVQQQFIRLVQFVKFPSYSSIEQD